MSVGDQVNLFNRFESRTIFKRSEERVLPVTLITGPLGAGKTTAVRRVLEQKANLKVCCAVNDFARVNVDERRIASTQQEQAHSHSHSSHTHSSHTHSHSHAKEHPGVVALSNGCVCCDLLPQMRSALGELLDVERVPEAFDYLLLETSGVSDPWALVEALDARFGPLYRARLDQVVTVLDTSVLFDGADEPDEPAAAAESDCERLAPAVRSQIAAADLVLLNKCDLVAEPCVARAERCVRALNGAARVRRSTRADVPLHELLDVEIDESHAGASGVLSHEASVAARLYRPASGGRKLRTEKPSEARGAHAHSAALLRSFACDALPPLSLARFQDFVYRLPRSVVRGKGALRFAAGGACAFNLAGNGRHADVELEPADADCAHLAFVGGADIEPARLEAALAACAGAPPAAAAAVPRALAADKRFDWRTLDNDSILLFRVNATHTGVDEGEMRAYHGVTLDKVNRALLRAANAVNAGRRAAEREPLCLLTPAVAADERGNDAFFLRYALASADATPERMWRAVAHVADDVLARQFQGIGCRCKY